MLGRSRLVAEQERRVDLLDVDTSGLFRLEGARVLHQATHDFLRIGEGSFGGKFYAAAALSSFSAPRMTIFSTSSGNRAL